MPRVPCYVLCFHTDTTIFGLMHSVVHIYFKNSESRTCTRDMIQAQLDGWLIAVLQENTIINRDAFRNVTSTENVIRNVISERNRLHRRWSLKDDRGEGNTDRSLERYRNLALGLNPSSDTRCVCMSRIVSQDRFRRCEDSLLRVRVSFKDCIYCSIFHLRR